jgi:hypothetical protein
MKTLVTPISDDTYDDLHRVTAHLGVAPEDFVGRVLARAVRRQKMRMLEEQHRAGYESQPVRAGEFDLNAADPLLPGDDETW